MLEKPLYIMLFMYAASFGMLGAQYMLGDIMGVEMKNWEGASIKSELLTTIQVDQLTTTAQNIVGTNQTSVTTDPISTAANIAWELFLLLTGTYIFEVLHDLGVPMIVVTGMLILYIIMLSRAIIGYLRGI